MTQCFILIILKLLGIHKWRQIKTIVYILCRALKTLKSTIPMLSGWWQRVRGMLRHVAWFSWGLYHAVELIRSCHRNLTPPVHATQIYVTCLLKYQGETFDFHCTCHRCILEVCDGRWMIVKHTVDGSQIPRSTTWDGAKTL